MSDEYHDTYEECHRLVNELMEQERLKPAHAVLRVLRQFVELVPMVRKDACREHTAFKLQQVTSKLNAQRARSKEPNP